MKTLLLIGTLLISMLLASCSGGATETAPTPSDAIGSTSVPVPTSTPSAAVSPLPTSVPAPATPPTQTPQPVPVAPSTPTPTPALPSSPEPTPMPPPPIGTIAPELVGTQEWVNSDPLKIGDLRGKVVLVDFWTYTCINCIRTLPYMKVWHSKYADDGLVIIGVHTPEFRFEHEIDNVRDAVADYSLTWPVVQDNNFATWRAFNNRYWPAKYLIDQNGVIRYRHYGEGAYYETEAMILELLEERGVNVAPVAPSHAPNKDLDPNFKNNRGSAITAELYGGYGWSCSIHNLYSNSAVANPEYCTSRDQVVEYTDSGERENHALYLHGSWIAERDILRHARETENHEDYMLLRFSARSVNVILTPRNDETFKVLVKLDGEYLNESNKGKNVVIENDGKSYLVVDNPGFFSVVEAPEYGVYNLELSSNSSDFALFAFTFDVYAEDA